MKEPEAKRLNRLQRPPVLEMEEMEQRLELMALGDREGEDMLCVWYACSDVCPPGG